MSIACCKRLANEFTHPGLQKSACLPAVSGTPPSVEAMQGTPTDLASRG